MKDMYPILNHVTCIVHGLHRVCESIRENYNSVNDFIAALKKIPVNAPNRKVLYQEVTSTVSCHHKVEYFNKMRSFLVRKL